jgi:hypothetical protein
MNWWLFLDWSGLLQNRERLFQMRLHLSESEPQCVHFSFGMMSYASETIDFVIDQAETRIILIKPFVDLSKARINLGKARINLIKARINFPFKGVDSLVELLLEGVDSLVDLLLEGADALVNLLLESVDSFIDLLIERADSFKDRFDGGPGSHVVSHFSSPLPRKIVEELIRLQGEPVNAAAQSQSGYQGACLI